MHLPHFWGSKFEFRWFVGNIPFNPQHQAPRAGYGRGSMSVDLRRRALVCWIIFFSVVRGEAKRLWKSIFPIGYGEPVGATNWVYRPHDRGLQMDIDRLFHSARLYMQPGRPHFAVINQEGRPFGQHKDYDRWSFLPRNGWIAFRCTRTRANQQVAAGARWRDLQEQIHPGVFTRIATRRFPVNHGHFGGYHILRKKNIWHFAFELSCVYIIYVIIYI